MKLEEIKLSHMRNFLDWFKREEKDIPFTKASLWRLKKECWQSDLEVYWDYRDELSKDQVESMLENGLEGYYDACNELIDLKHDHMWEIKQQFIKELTIELEDLTEKFVLSAMEDYECERDEVLEYAEDTLFEFIREAFEEELSVNLPFDELIKQHSGAIYVDCEDFRKYDFMNPEQLKAEKLLFSRIKDPESDSEIDLYDEELGCASVDDLDEEECFSVCIADSLDEYLDMLGEAQKKQDSDNAKLFFMANIGGYKYYVNRDSLYLDDEPNFETMDSTVEFMDEETYKKTPCSSYDDYDGFKYEYNNHIMAYAQKWFNENKNDLSKKDGYGRTIVHYALVLHASSLVDMNEVVSDIESQDKKYLYYTEDRNGISPFCLTSHIGSLEDTCEVTEECILSYVNAAYGTTLNSLPRKNETCFVWETSSTLIGTRGDKVYQIIECDTPHHSLEDFILDTKVICRDANTNSFVSKTIDYFENMQLLDKPVKIYLDGTVAA